MKDSETTINEIKKLIKEFISEREWEKYHNPKNIAESICIESSELLELFQWRNTEESEKLIKNDKFKEKVSEEIADIIIFSLSMAIRANFDVTKAIIKKLKINKEKYPVEKYKGKAFLE